jgi:hypothetical protein
MVRTRLTTTTQIHQLVQIFTYIYFPLIENRKVFQDELSLHKLSPPSERTVLPAGVFHNPLLDVMEYGSEPFAQGYLNNQGCLCPTQS